MAVHGVARHHPQMLNGDTSLRAIGLRIIATREALGLNQATFARLAGLSPQAMNNYERGLQRPALDQAIMLCRTHGCTLDWIYLGDRSGLPGRILEKLAPEPVERQRA